MKISKPGLYQGFSAPVYNNSVRHSVYVQVHDGTKLAVDYYIPAIQMEEQKGTWPVILEFTPYDRVLYRSNGELTIESYDHYDTECSVDLYTSYGYVYARADVRGKGASYGTRTASNSRDEAADGRDIVEWLAKQPWSTGKVGLVGSSYTGQTQLEIISMKPEHLKAACVGCTDFNHYDGWIRGGIPRAFGSNPDVTLVEKSEESSESKEKKPHFAAEQGDIMTISDAVNSTVPVDEDPDKTMLRQAIREHIDNGPQIPHFRDLHFRDSYSPYVNAPYWQIASASTHLKEINDSGVAMYLLGGMVDVFRRDTVIMYENLTVPKKMTIGPWSHCMTKYSPAWPVEHLRWFDYWLKGIDNGIMAEPPVLVKTLQAEMGEDYAFHQNWPAQEGTRDILYLSDGCLVEKKTDADAFIDYEGVYGIRTHVEDHLATDVNERGLVFTGSVLDEDYRVCGHPMAHVNFSVENEGIDDVDIFCVLSDYDPATGESILVSDGRLRTSLRKTHEAPYNFLGLPWHRCNEEDEEKLETGKTYELLIDMMPTSYRFKKGHRIRLALSNSLRGFYYKGKAEFEADPEGCLRPILRFCTGGEKASFIELPDIYA